MNREIKFRAWDNTKKEWTLNIMECVSSRTGDIWMEPALKSHEVVIEQYTGLIDKNGKEIYEGDIVKARWYRAKHARLDTKGEVKFDDGWFYIYDDPDGQDRLGVPVHNCYDLEVIGNIHENSELLGGGK
jgi:uncharacterized phage protein (TIGR01671 family)